MMSESEMAALVADISENGLAEPIELDVLGNLIDGRNRASACEALGIVPAQQEFDGDVWKHVISRNLHRRHLSESQRAMIAARFATRPWGNRHQGESPIDDSPATRSEASKALQVGPSSTDRAKKVIEQGVPGLADLVVEGKASVHAASKVAQLPDEEQRAIVARVAAGESFKKCVPKKKVVTPASQLAMPQPPKLGGNRRKHAQQIDALIIQIDGATAAFEGITDLDRSVTTTEAARLADGLSEAMKTLRKIHNLIKERSQ